MNLFYCRAPKFRSPFTAGTLELSREPGGIHVLPTRLHQHHRSWQHRNLAGRQVAPHRSGHQGHPRGAWKRRHRRGLHREGSGRRPRDLDGLCHDRSPRGQLHRCFPRPWPPSSPVVLASDRGIGRGHRIPGPRRTWQLAKQVGVAVSNIVLPCVGQLPRRAAPPLQRTFPTWAREPLPDGRAQWRMYRRWEDGAFVVRYTSKPGASRAEMATDLREHRALFPARTATGMQVAETTPAHAHDSAPAIEPQAGCPATQEASPPCPVVHADRQPLQESLF